MKQIAFKVVRSDLTSLFVETPLSIKYAVGQTFEGRHPKLPLFIVESAKIDPEKKWGLHTGSGQGTVLVVEHEDGDNIAKNCPFSIHRETIASVLKSLEYDDNFRCVHKLKVLEVVDQSKFSSAAEALKHFKRKYAPAVKEIFHLERDFYYYRSRGELALCPELVKWGCGSTPANVQVTVSTKRMHRSKVVWVNMDTISGQWFTDKNEWGFRKGKPVRDAARKGMFKPVNSLCKRLFAGLKGWQQLHISIKAS